MKKVFLFLLASSLSIAMHASVGYLLSGTPGNTTSGINATEVADVYTYLPYEEDGQGHEVSPERKAYEYIQSSCTLFTLKDLTDGKLIAYSRPAVDVLWVNVDRVGLSLGDFDGMFNNDVKTALSNYVKAGGHLYLTKQAGRLVAEIGRAKWFPNDYTSNGYVDGSDEWQMCFHFCTNGNVENPNHASLKYMENGQTQDGLSFNTRYPLVSGSGTYRRTDNNCGWGDWGLYWAQGSHEPGENDGGCEIGRRNNFERTMNCKVLGGWGHERIMSYAGMIEFYPNGDYKGTVMVMALAAYQWGPQNLSEYNVKNLTRGIVEYLESIQPVYPVYTRPVTNGELGTICLGYDVSADGIEGATIYEVACAMEDREAKEYVYLRQVTEMSKDRPYFYLATSNELRLTYAGTKTTLEETNIKHSGLHGVLNDEEYIVPIDDNHYKLSEDALYIVDSDTRIARNNAYIKYNEVLDYVAPAPGEVRRKLPIRQASGPCANCFRITIQ